VVGKHRVPQVERRSGASEGWRREGAIGQRNACALGVLAREGSTALIRGIGKENQTRGSVRVKRKG